MVACLTICLTFQLVVGLSALAPVVRPPFRSARESPLCIRFHLFALGYSLLGLKDVPLDRESDATDYICLVVGKTSTTPLLLRYQHTKYLLGTCSYYTHIFT